MFLKVVLMIRHVLEIIFIKGRTNLPYFSRFVIFSGYCHGGLSLILLDLLYCILIKWTNLDNRIVVVCHSVYAYNISVLAHLIY